MSDTVSPAEIRGALQKMLEEIQRGEAKSVSFKILTEAGEHAFDLPLETEEQRAAARIGIRRMLDDLAG
jgi:hypothetical protein